MVRKRHEKVIQPELLLERPDEALVLSELEREIEKLRPEVERYERLLRLRRSRVASAAGVRARREERDRRATAIRTAADRDSGDPRNRVKRLASRLDWPEHTVRRALKDWIPSKD